MLNRRQFLGYSALLPLLLTSRPSLADSEFERYMREQEAGASAINDEWQQYHDQYLKAFQDYQAKLNKVWSEASISSEKSWVAYSDDLNIRRTVDFEKNEVRIEITGDELKKAPIDKNKIINELNKALNTPVTNAYQSDPTLTHSIGNQAPSAKQSVSGVSKQNVNQLVNNSTKRLDKTAKGDVVVVTIPLAAAALGQREQNYLPTVQKEAKRWKLQPSLVLAVIQTESAFNPMARSHIPAFGLMQIVPSSAGKDATRHAWKKETLLTGSQLFKPETNIELGCAYLNLLDTRYLAAVKDPQSRLYCVICAYNTGAGNVAKAFTGKTNVNQAATRINNMTPNQVKNHLLRNLPYEETRNYLARVIERMGKYQA